MEVLTASKLNQPRMKIRIPDAMTMRQNAMPSSSWLPEGLLRLPMTLIPRTIIANARVTKPWLGLRSGQLRAKYPRNSESSETIRNTANVSLVLPIAMTNQLTACHQCDDMADSIEEEEMRVGINLDKHDHTRGDDCEEGDNIGHADAVQDDVAWTGQRLL